MDYETLGKNIRKYRLLSGMRQEDLAEACDCSHSHICHIENACGVPSLEMVVQIANTLGVTIDQLLCTYYKNPEVVYLREIAERVATYPVAQRIQVCESFASYLDALESFMKK